MFIIAAAAAAAAAAAPVDVVAGAAFGAVERDWVRLLRVFVRSLHAASPPTTHLLLGIDAAGAGAVAADLAAWGPRLSTLSLGEARHATPRLWHDMGINKSRYAAYVEMARRARALAGGPAAAPALDARGCPDWTTAPLVLLTDTRDVWFQGDPFGPARDYIRRLHAVHEAQQRGGAGGCMRAPLLVVAEPELYRLGSEGKNDALFLECFRPGLEALWTGRPVVCSGTTLGVLPAIDAYLAAMTAGMALAAPGSAATDQALHQALVYAAGALAGGAAPAALPLAREPAYAALYRLAGALAAAVGAPAIRAHEDGWVCTMTLWSLEHCWPLGGDHRISPAHGATPCAVLHQWDREALHHALAGPATLGAAPGGDGARACNRGFFHGLFEDCYEVGAPPLGADGAPSNELGADSGGDADGAPPTERVADCGGDARVLTADGRLPRCALADPARFAAPPNVTWLPAATFHDARLVAGDALIARSRRWSATSWGRGAPPPPGVTAAAA